MPLQEPSTSNMRMALYSLPSNKITAVCFKSKMLLVLYAARYGPLTRLFWELGPALSSHLAPAQNSPIIGPYPTHLCQ
jgi:hypothetical protein